ncbi:co-chaperone HscB [Psychromonas algicola]|uniref:co-chaperone HscB n=1 Tax=Psychromonas algicola TaxID=2555642 RepID=UPI0010672DA7|nr:co-chaperone HscB [Psychromonas sp. RZ5]TEW52497.1 co-chaperone HscB [Psychromonas sp. RZ5]
MNYFELFSLPTDYSIDKTRLSQTYRDLQKQYHPDKFAMQDDKTRLQAMQKSTEINDAFETLKDSCLRAQYILKLSGLDIELEQRTLQDTDFLMQQMEWREKVADFTEDDEDEIEAFSKDISKLVSDLEADIETALKNKTLEITANLIRKLKFMLKLQVELELLEEKLFD